MKTSFIVLRLAVILILAFLPLAASPAQNAIAAPAPEVVAPVVVEPAPLQEAIPSLALGVPSAVPLGSEFTFTATFTNTGGLPNEVGYGPFIDLVFPATGEDGVYPGTDPADLYDGVTFVGADFMGIAIDDPSQVFVQTFPDDGGGTGCVQHPVAVRPANDPPPPANPNLPRYYEVCGTAGDQFVTIILPFGSFVPSQPPAAVTITAQMSDLADLSTPLTIRGQAGFQFGYTPLNDFCCSPFDSTIPVAPGGVYDSSAFPGQSVAPTLMSLSKAYVGPENETATGPNFPRQYTITVDIADGQPISELTITDTLPNNIQYVSLDSVTVGGSPAAYTILTEPLTTTPGGTLEVELDNPVVGGNAVELTFTFYVDRLDAASAVVLDPVTGVFVESDNTARADGTWDTPLDPRDFIPGNLPTPSAICPSPCVVIEDQSLAIQKGVANLTDSENNPGDVLEYTLQFQVSDFFGFEGLVISDVFTDGQRFDDSFVPRLTINGNTYTLGALGMTKANYDVTCDYRTGTFPGDDGAECDNQLSLPGPTDPVVSGSTTLTFRVSDEIITRGENGQLLGGCVDPAAANNPVLCSGAGPIFEDGPTTGTLTFRTVIQDQFSDLHLASGNSGDASVDHGDVLANAVDLSGTVLNVAVAPVGGLFSAQSGNPKPGDGSGAGVTIAFGELQKRIYAINGSTTIPTFLAPGDVVTYRLTYTQPSSDFEETTFTDYLPLPVFDATELGASGSIDFATEDFASCGIPDAGEVCLGPIDDYHTLNSRGEDLTPAVPAGNPVVTPTYVTDGPANRLTITYPEYDSIYNISSTIDILFSVTVTADPFADGLFLTNQVTAGEGTTNADDQFLDEIVQIRLGQPVLRIGKTAVSSDHVPDTDIVFTPDQTIYDDFELPGLAVAPFTPTIASNDLSTDPNDPDFAFNLFNGLREGVDNDDLIKYAIIIENKGNSPNGAYDIAIQDILPAGMAIPAGGLNLQIYNGAGDAYGFEVVDFGPDTQYGTVDDVVTPGNAANSVRIFDTGYAIRVVDPSGVDVPGACQVHSLTSGANIIVITYDLLLDDADTAGKSIINTASIIGYSGTPDGPNHLQVPEDDDAEVITNRLPGLTKTLVETEFDVTGNNLANQAVIGEIVTYEVEVKFFELETPDAVLVDTLDAGLAFVDLVSVVNSNPATLDIPTMTFDSGTGECDIADIADGCFAGTNPALHNPVISNNGGTITFDFGDVVNNTDTNNLVAETITITYRAVVLNAIGNQQDTQLNNSANLTWINASDPINGSQTVSAENVTVVEPVVTIVKSASAFLALDAGDPLTYSFTITSNVTDAYDVTFDDPLPLYFTPDDVGTGGDFTATLGASNITNQFELVGSGTTLDPYRLRTTAAANIDLEPGNTIAVSINGTISYAAPANSTLTNTATVYWTSLDDSTVTNPATVTDRSSYNLNDSDERTGADGVGGALNDYAAESTIVTSVTNPLVLTKELISTSEAHTSGADVAIGEIARFRLIVEVPEGTNQSLIFEDALPFGLTFLNDGTATMAFVCNGASPCAVSSLHPGTSWIINGASGAVTPTYVLPDGAVSSSRTLNEDLYSTGVPVVFKMGDLVNNDNDADIEYAVVEFNVLVDNSLAGSNDNGETRDNTFQAFVNLSQSGNTGGPVTLTVREPLINNVNKTLTAPVPTSFDAGDTVSFTVTFSNTGATDAFDVILSDSLHPTLDLISVGAPTYSAACTTTPVAVNNSNTGAGNNVSFTFDRVIPTCQVSVVYIADILYTVTPQVVLTNIAEVTYTSLPGTGSTGNLTGSNTPGGSGALNGERNGTGSNPPNDYFDDDDQDITIDNASLAKTIVSTSEAGTSEVASPRPLMIGEVARYRLVMTIPEGVTNTLSFLDNIPTDMQYLDDGTAALAFVSDTGATCNIISDDPDLTGGTLCIVGNETSIPAPTFIMPAVQLANETSAGNPFLSGHDARISLGTVTNNDDDANDELVVFEFNARVLNTTTSDRGDILTNSANAYTGATSLASSSVNAIIVEPVVTIAKARAGTQVDAGDEYTYTLTVTASSAANTTTAYDLVVTDTLPYTVNNAVIDLVSVAFAAPGGVTVTDTSTYNASPNPDVASATIDQLAPGQVVTLTLTVKILDRWPVGRRIDNVGSVTWTSLPADGSPNERFGTNPIVAPNDYYAVSTSNQVTPSANPLIDKKILSDTTYTIGEDVTYDIVVTLPEGITRNLRIQDVLPTGLSYQSHSLVTTAAASGGLLTLDYLGTPAISASPSVGATGTLLFTFGDTTNPSDSPNNNLTANNAFLLRITARVDNIASNVDGTVRLNTASLLYYRGTTSTDTTVTDTTNNTNLTIVEPRITTDKSVTAPLGNVQAGDVVSYTARFTNTGNSTAFEVTALDTLAQGVAYNSGSAACEYFDGTTTAPITVSVVDGGTTITFDGNPAGSWDIPATDPDSYIECDYTVTAQSALILDGTKLNTIDADWSSMPGTFTGERIYDDPTPAYPFDGTQDTDTATFPTGAPTIVKDDGGVTQTVIGDVIHFTLTIASPLGTLNNAEVVDHLPAGLIYVTPSQTVSAGVNAPTFTPVGPVDGSGPVTLTWDFGAGAVVTTSPFTIEYDAIVANVASNQNLTVLLNDVDLNYDDVAGTPKTVSDDEESTITEPDLDIVKDAASIAVNPDAGDTVTYTITLAHGASSTATAYDVRFEDILPAYADLQIGTVNVSGAGTATVNDLSNDGSNTIEITISDIPIGNTVTITYEAILTSALNPNQLIQNTGDVYWTSMPGDNNPGDGDGERDGEGTNPPNDYHDSDTGDLTADNIEPVKSILATSETHTGATLPNAADVAIGEILRYRLAVAVPEGTSNDFIISDQLSVNAGTALVTPILDNTMQITAVNFDAGHFDSADFGAALEAANGSPVDLYNAGGAAQFTLPFDLVTLSAGNLLTFNLGDIVNLDTNPDADVEYIYIEFNVLVANVTDNTLGDILANDFDVTINSGAPVISNTVNATVVEPQLNVAKSASADTDWEYGDTVTFTIVLENLAANASTADAFNVSVSDLIPATLTYQTATITSDYPGCTPNDSADPTLTWTCASFPLGTTATFTYQIEVNDELTTPHLTGIAPFDVAENTVNVTWTSLPGTGTTGNPTGSDTPGGSGDSDGERNGTDPIVQPNDYVDSDTHSGSLVDYYSLGNRVWFDTNNNSLMDVGELGAPNVRAELYQADGLTAVLDSGGNPIFDITNADGFYLFDYLVPGDYVVVIPAAEFGVGGDLRYYLSSGTQMSNSGVISEAAAAPVNSNGLDGVPNTTDDDIDVDDNGTDEDLSIATGRVVSSVVTLGPSGLTEHTGEIVAQLESGVLGDQGAQPDGRANLTADFGFYQVAIGNLVYRDDVPDGVYVSGDDTPLSGVTVELLSGDGATVLDTASTNASGEYEFLGWPEGDYRVRVITPGGLVSTVDSDTPSDTTDPDGEVDDNDNGIGIGAATSVSVTSGQLTMDAGEAGGTITVSGGTTRDDGLDFGFVYAYSLGNRVWFDTDNNAVMDAGEQPVGDVLVDLYAASDLSTVLASDVTTAGGFYLFEYLNPGEYVVSIAADNFSVDGSNDALVGYWSSGTSMDGAGAITETPSPATDADTDPTDADDNGALIGARVLSQPVLLGLTGNTEPTGEIAAQLESGILGNQGAQPDGRANLTVDFGFYRVEIGNLVFFDANRNGTYVPADGDTTMDGANVRLYAANNLNEIPVGPDGILGTADDLAGGVATSGGGLYLFSGLPEGDYVIRATPSSNGVTSTTDAFNQADNDDPDVNADNNDNGDGTAPGQVASAVLTMDAAESAANIAVDNATGSTTDLTVDFGFVDMVAIGNRVWFDTGAGAGGVADDGIQNGTEAGVPGVRVELYTSGGVFVDLDTTDVNGDYYFDLLYPGQYYVFIPSSQFDDSGDVLYGYVSSTGNGLVDDDSDQDVDENGIDESDLASNGIRTPVYTLEPNTEPTADADTGYAGPLDDDNVNLTADFGFLQLVAIGNRVWFDTGAGADYNNGELDAGETPVDDVTVNLYTSAGVFVDTTTTANGGYYYFDMLAPGDYYVFIPASEFNGTEELVGYVSSTGDVVTENDDEEVDENGIDAHEALNGIRSATYTITPNAEPTLEGQSFYPGFLDDDNVNATLDFGFTQLVAIGNRVWFDTGAGGGTADDGIQNGAEAGVSGVRVELYTSGGVFVDFDVTDGNGDYYFDMLNPGDYYVFIPGNQFDGAGDALYGYVSSTGNGLVDDDNDQDADENGIDEIDLPANGIRTPDYTLSVDSEPTADDDAGYPGYLDDDNVNLTADFGFLQKVAIGNIVWLDNGGTTGIANNGILDGDEVGIEDVTVELYDSTNTLAGTATTDASGYYVFDNLLPGSYYLVIPATEFQTGGDLENLLSSSGNGADETTNETGDENGIDSVTPETTGITSTVFDLQPDSEQTGEPQPNYTGALDDNNVNFTADFGFTELVAIGNRVWFDTGAGAFYNNGILDAGETPVDDVTVNLYTSVGVLVDTTTTAGGGYYEFDMLLPGQYYVQLPAAEFQVGGDLEGYVSTTITGADETSDNDADENGIDVATLTTTGIRTQVYDLQPNSETTAEDEINYSGVLDDDNVNFTADFSFVQLVAIGNRIWFDTGAGGGTADDGIQNGAEAGVAGVDVELYRVGQTPGADTPVDSDTTDANGDYEFDLLLPDDYFVHIPADQFDDSSDALYGYVSSTGNGADETSDQDSDENGIDDADLPANGISSTPFTLTPNAETTADDETSYTGYLDDDNINFTADFGFLQFVAIGNRVWLDTGAGAFYNNGILDAGEIPVDGVTVDLYTSGGTFVDTTITSGGGYYEFDMLFPGQYYVQIPASMFDAIAPSPLAGYVSSLGNGIAGDDDDNSLDENGIDTATLATTGIRTPDYDLQPNGEPISEDQTNYTGFLDDDNVNFTADFSFVRLVAIGNRIWFDTGLLGGTPDNGIQDGGELGVSGVDVELFLVGQNPATDTPIAIDTTDASGNYQFDLLNPGDYFIHIPSTEFQAGGPLEGFFSSTGNGADETSDQDADENGIDSATLPVDGISSTAFTLTPDTETTLDDEASYTGYLDDDNVNFTADFGFLQLVAIGNVVWEDSGAGGGIANNGIQDGAEPGILGVDLQLFHVGDVPGTDAPVASTTTIAGGYYEFDNLLPGDYFIFIPAAEFQGSATLSGYTSSAGNGNDETSDEDVDENGIDNAAPWTNGITSTNYTLQPNSEQIGEPQPNYTGGLGDSDVNFTADFGFFNSPIVDLGVTKDDGTTYYLAGGTLTYEIIVTNYGPIDVIGAVVSDSIPAQIASWNWVCSGATGGATGCDGVAGSNTDFTDTVNLPVGSTITYTVTATVDAAATGQLTNTVIVAPPAGTVDTNPSNDNDLDVDEPASLTVTKTNSVTVVAIGTQFVYDIEVTNNGGVALSDLTVVDTLPAEVTFVSAVPVPSNVSGSTLTWNHVALGLAGALAPGDSVNIQVTVDVTSVPTSPGGDITNSVTVSNSIPNVTASATHTDVVADNRMKSLIGTIMAAGIDPVTGVVIPSVPDYTTTPEVAIGEILTYQISVDVPAGLTLTNLRALDTMDAGLAFVRCVGITSGSLTTTLPGGFTDACNAPVNPTVGREPLSSSSAYDDGRRIEFTLGDVSATGAETLTIIYEVIVLDIPANVDGVGGLNNQVTWSWDGGSLTASADPVEVVEPELSIEKDANPTVAPYGATITFTLDIAHTIDSTADAFDVIVTDILPPGLAFIPGTVVTTGLPPTTIDYDAASTTLTFIWDVFPLNETALLTFQATFVGPAPVINTSNVAWTSLPIDPGLGGDPEQISLYNDYSTERWYDPADNSGVNNYGVSDSITIRIPGLPETGFAPGRVTALPAQSADKQYAAMDSMWLEIPDLGLTMPLTGVPLTADGWDLTWLSNQAGYLQGTTYPGEVGTMGITSHVTLADGTPGPFRNLGKLFWGNKIILHADGYRYVYEVRDQRTVLPTDLSVFKKDGYTWMTLLTCEGYVPWLDSYNYRLAVRAVLLSVEPDSSASPFPVRSPAPAQRGIDR
ncbi:MAG: isopeptide-forming domain-containing fimbrial protein [Anaerolineae bacterium]|nr:isopeptide-forming domain-containing fimbrial protein [Anaerolineae bacterium]